MEVKCLSAVTGRFTWGGWMGTRRLGPYRVPRTGCPRPAGHFCHCNRPQEPGDTAHEYVCNMGTAPCMGSSRQQPFSCCFAATQWDSCQNDSLWPVWQCLFLIKLSSLEVSSLTPVSPFHIEGFNLETHRTWPCAHQADLYCVLPQRHAL